MTFIKFPKDPPEVEWVEELIPCEGFADIGVPALYCPTENKIKISWKYFIKLCKRLHVDPVTMLDIIIIHELAHWGLEDEGRDEMRWPEDENEKYRICNKATTDVSSALTTGF